ncbi:MAG: ATP-binding protein [Candidatus Limnocylindria bacterium]
MAPPLRELRPDVSEPLLEILAELIDNAMTHGDSPVGSEFSLRADAASVLTTVIDHGIGIRAHLARAGVATENDAQAIGVAVRAGTTGAHEPRGYGLPDSIEALDRVAPASLTIRSGAGQGSFETHGQAAFSDLDATIGGTMVTVRIARVLHP